MCALPASGGERLAQLGQGILGREPVGLAGAKVVAGVVGRVAPQAQRSGLDQHRPRGPAHLLDDRAELPGGAHGVPAVDDEPFHPVPLGAPPELGALLELLAHGRRVGVAVVLDHEHDRQGEERGQVHRLVHVARARGAVAEEREADRLPAEPALRVGGAEDGAAHRPQVADHRKRAVRRVPVVDVALARLGRAVRVREILVQVLAEVPAPDQVAAEVAVGEADDVDRLVGEERQGDDHPLVALAAGDGALDQALAEEVEDAVVRGARELHPGVDLQQGSRRVLVQVRGAQVARCEDGGSFGECHGRAFTLSAAGRVGKLVVDRPRAGAQTPSILRSRAMWRPPSKSVDEPGADDLQGLLRGDRPLADREAVAVVVGAVPDRGLLRPADPAAHAPHPVGDDRLAVAGPAEHDTALELAPRDRLGHRPDEVRKVAGFLGVGSQVADACARPRAGRP